MKKVVLIIFSISLLYSLTSIYNDAKIEIKTSLNETFDKKTNVYKADLTFKLEGFQKDKVENVEVLFVNVDQSTKFLKVNKKGNTYSINPLEVTFSPKDIKKLHQTRPDFIILWNIGSEKYINYAYKKKSSFLLEVSR